MNNETLVSLKDFKLFDLSSLSLTRVKFEKSKTQKFVNLKYLIFRMLARRALTRVPLLRSLSVTNSLNNDVRLSVDFTLVQSVVVNIKAAR